MSTDNIRREAYEWLYAEDHKRHSVEVVFSGHQEPGRPSYAPCLEYALRLSKSKLVPQEPGVEGVARSQKVQSWLHFQRDRYTDGILPETGLTFMIGAPLYGIKHREWPLPIYAFAYDTETLVARYDPTVASTLDRKQLSDVLYLTLEQHLDEDDYDDHHGLDRERQEIYLRAEIFADAIVDADPDIGFRHLFGRHVENFSTSMPWPAKEMVFQAKDGRVSVTVRP